MARKSTIKLLLINKSDNEGERLISLFRNAGRVARASRAASAEELHSMLDKDRWDLLIADDKHPEIAVEQCLEQLKKQNIEIPSIVLRDDNIEAALEAGASDVVATDDDQRLIYSAFRELQHLNTSRQLASITEKLADAEERCELLMAQSQDAIAYVADGMVINSNTLFSNRFGYAEPDDLDCAPVIDLIDPADQDTFKGLLKTQINNGEGSTDFNFTGLKQNEDAFSASMQLSNAVFDEEPCIQLTIRDAGASSSGSSAVNLDHDPATGLYSHDYFLTQLDSCAKQAAAGTNVATLLFIGIDKFSEFRSRFGITHAYNILLNIATFIQAQSDDSQCLAHFCDDGFTMLLHDIGAEKSQKYAEKLCKKIEKHIIEVEGQSIQCTASIGLLVINGLQPEDPNTLIDKAFSACEDVRTQADNEGIGNGVLQFVPTLEKKVLGDAEGDEELDTFLEEALNDEQFSLTFQPVVSLRGASGDHYEVRITMKDENGEELTADQFSSNISFSGINTRLDRWILLEATKKLAQQIEDGHNTRLLINLTANALQDESLISWLGVALKAGGLPAESLIFQYSETDITNFLKPAKQFSEAIKEMGCKISIEDFGQSDDPFKALKHVHADYAKIADKYAEQLQTGGDIQVLKSMVSSINEEQTQAIISGVENAAALAQLWQIGVDYIQGGYLSPPAHTMDYEFTDIA